MACRQQLQDRERNACFQHSGSFGSGRKNPRILHQSVKVTNGAVERDRASDGVHNSVITRITPLFFCLCASTFSRRTRLLGYAKQLQGSGEPEQPGGPRPLLLRQICAPRARRPGQEERTCLSGEGKRRQQASQTLNADLEVKVEAPPTRSRPNGGRFLVQ